MLEHGSREKKMVALTVDDCYYNRRERIVEDVALCNKYGVHMTFFPVVKTGCLVEKCRDIWQSVVDAGCEILDARIPMASRNPDVDRLAGSKPRIVVLNRTDLADANATARWRAWFKARNMAVLETDSRSGKGVKGFAGAVRSVLKDTIEAYAAKGQVGRPMRVIINQVARRKAAAAGDRPGVTRGKQWITVDKGLELLDTPGILWPRFDSQEVGELLAITGAIKAEVLDRETLGANFLLRLARVAPEAVNQRYKFLPDPALGGFALLEQAAKKRGFLISGGEYDTERMAAVLLDEYRSGKLGRLTLELPEEGA